MDFLSAVKAMKEGKKVRCSSYTNTHYYLCVKESNNFKIMDHIDVPAELTIEEIEATA